MDSWKYLNGYNMKKVIVDGKLTGRPQAPRQKEGWGTKNGQRNWCTVEKCSGESPYQPIE